MRHSKKQLPGVLALWAYFVPSTYRLALTICTVAKRFGWIFVLSGDSFLRSHSQRSCCIELPRDRFSKKQWQTKKKYQRRCTSCIDSNQGCTLFDKALFKQPPRKEDCPICFLRLPSLSTGNSYMSCCGKTICTGCLYAGAMVGDDQLCPFCRVPAPTSEEVVKRVKTRMDVGDAEAIYDLAIIMQKVRVIVS